MQRRTKSTFRGIVVAATLLAVVVGGAACAQPSDAPVDPSTDVVTNAPRIAPEPDPDARLVLLPPGVQPRESGDHVFTVEVASTYAQREVGLMGRESLAPQAGMLFVYKEHGRRSFWMKDCLIGLDIAFLDADARIIQTATLPPGAGLTGEKVPSVQCEGEVAFVLEVRARRLAELGVGTGDRVDLRAAVEGIEPE